METKDTPDWSTTDWSPDLLRSILVALLSELDWKIPEVPDVSKGSVRVIRPGEPSHGKCLSRELCRKLAPVANSLLQKWTVIERDLIDAIEKENADLRADSVKALSELAHISHELELALSEVTTFKENMFEQLEIAKKQENLRKEAETKAFDAGCAKGWKEGSDRMLDICIERHKYDGY